MGCCIMRPSTAGWIFAGPAIAVIAVFFGLPVLAAFALSLTDFDIYALADLDNLRFVGLGNYLDLLQNPLFWKALGNTLYFVVVGVPLSIVVSLGAALLLHSKLGYLKPLFRTAYFAPVVTINYEFYDNQTAESARELVEAIQRGERPQPTRGEDLVTFREIQAQLAGFGPGAPGTPGSAPAVTTMRADGVPAGSTSDGNA